jgi:hypothetical protein
MYSVAVDLALMEFLSCLEAAQAHAYAHKLALQNPNSGENTFNGDQAILKLEKAKELATQPISSLALALKNTIREQEHQFERWQVEEKGLLRDIAELKRQQQRRAAGQENLPSNISIGDEDVIDASKLAVWNQQLALVRLQMETHPLMITSKDLHTLLAAKATT